MYKEVDDTIHVDISLVGPHLVDISHDWMSYVTFGAFRVHVFG